MNQEALNIAVKAVQIYAATHPGIAAHQGGSSHGGAW